MISYLLPMLEATLLSSKIRRKALADKHAIVSLVFLAVDMSRKALSDRSTQIQLKDFACHVPVKFFQVAEDTHVPRRFQKLLLVVFRDVYGNYRANETTPLTSPHFMIIMRDVVNAHSCLHFRMYQTLNTVKKACFNKHLSDYVCSICFESLVKRLLQDEQSQFV